jgi:putative RecB family exonuclease
MKPLSLSATRLSTYQRCPKSYELKFLKKVPGAPVKAPLLGQILHQALAEVYRWPAWRGVPSLAVVQDHWSEAIKNHPELTSDLCVEGWRMLQDYHARQIAPLDQWREPVGVEGRIEGELTIDQVTFKLTGRYDRLDCLTTGNTQAVLHLVDYKTSRQQQSLPELERDLQLGLYQLALEQRYGQVLKKVSHVYLRTGDVVSFEVSTAQKALALEKIQALARDMLHREQFEAKTGKHCRACDARQYCDTFTETPKAYAPKPSVGVQLSLA